MNASTAKNPRVAFVGLGWIGRNRLSALAQEGLAEIGGLCDVQRNAVAQALEFAPNAILFSSFDDLIQEPWDGVVIATPNASHANQSIEALQRGMAVFCQKPLGRNAGETRTVVDAARENDRLLGVDLSYRFIPAMQQIRKLVRSGMLGQIFCVDLKFHNGYGPDKPWFYDSELAGGGCVLDLGIHLIDLALWSLEFPPVAETSCSLFVNGEHVQLTKRQLEHYAAAHISLANGCLLNLACSWKSNLGREAAIEITFHGTRADASLHNIAGSFYNFGGEHRIGTKRRSINGSGNADWNWGGQAIIDWCRRLKSLNAFDSEVATLVQVSETIDRIYECAGSPRRSIPVHPLSQSVAQNDSHEYAIERY